MTKERARIKAQKYLEWAEKAEEQSIKLHQEMRERFKNFDFTEPIKNGHHSQRRHEKVFETRNNMMRKIIELDKKAKSHRSKAGNLLAFANRNKGDAEKRRQEEREFNDNQISVGSKVQTVYGECEVVKVNTKSYRVKKLANDWCVTLDKSYVRLSKTN